MIQLKKKQLELYSSIKIRLLANQEFDTLFVACSDWLTVRLCMVSGKDQIYQQEQSNQTSCGN